MAESLRTDQDVEEILKLAIRNTGASDAALRQRLESAAHELGITPEALAAAEAQYRSQRVEREAQEREDAQFESAFQAHRKEEMKAMRDHAFSYVAVNAGLIFINAVTSFGQWWFFAPLMGWGIGLFFHLAFGLGEMLRPQEDQRADFRAKWEKKGRPLPPGVPR